MADIDGMCAQLDKAFRGPAWHGPSLLEALSGVSAVQAAARPLASAHTIAEIANHARAWKAIVRRRVLGEPVADVPTEQDWPPPDGVGPAAWETAQTLLEQEHLRLMSALANLPEPALDLAVGDDSAADVLRGSILHDVYHAGQVMLLRRELESSQASQAPTV
jgi:uncharacterized damage-inducible protein DinB